MKSDNNPVKSSLSVKILMGFSVVVMLAMIILCAVFISKNDISVSNVGSLAQYFKGGVISMALIIVALNVAKSFTLIFPPAVFYVLSGIIFDDLLTAVLVNVLGSVCSLILPYYLGRFMGLGAVNYLKDRFKAVRKLDDFTDENSFLVVFIVKVGLIPSDLSNFIFGAMDIPFKTYFFSSNLAMLLLNILWTILGAKADLSDPRSVLYALPAILFALLISLALGFYTKKKKQNKQKIETEEI